MKAHWIFGIALAAGFSAHAQECTVMVSAHVDRMMPAGMLLRAELKSAAMFRKIGVGVRWRTGAGRANAADNACGAPILIQLEDTGSAPVSPDALAYATPFTESGTCIHVLVDRLLQVGNERLTTAVLAHVLAHEITHVLERVDWHSEEGIMKAHWDHLDYGIMLWHSLPFSPEDVELIHRGIAQRVLRAAAE
jgi:hypothetical protein